MTNSWGHWEGARDYFQAQMGKEMQWRCVIISSALKQALLPDHPLTSTDALLPTHNPPLPPRGTVSHQRPT